MQESSYLTFSFNKLRYAIPTLTVQEIFFLPEVTPVPETPKDIIGIINVRGTIIPIMDLNQRFGYNPINYRLEDSIIIINWQELRVGIIVNEVYDVRNISADQITNKLSHDLSNFEEFAPEKFIEGIYPSGDELFTLLNLENLLHYVEAQNIPKEVEELEKITDDDTISLTKESVFCPNATPEERIIYQKRAVNLRTVTTKKDLTNVKPIAVVTFSDESFGIDLQLVREFITFSKMTLIPCTPSHILGNINLRGEILTLIDLSGFFNLPTSQVKNRNNAVVVNVEGIVAGITIDEVRDIILLDPKNITDVPTIYAVNEDYLQGVIPYEGKMLSILDLSQVFFEGGLIVDEAV
jgi:purine-binding chemotaxis protein CheW